MSNTKAKRHTHKYHRVEVGYTKLWACALPDCNHYMPPHMSKLVEGKASLCWICEEPFVLNLDHMKVDKPKCDDCMAIAARMKQVQSVSEPNQ